MDYLNLLRGVARGGAVDAELERGLPPRELRFVLEYPERPDVAQEQARLERLLAPAAPRLEPLVEEGRLGPFILLRIPGVERKLPQRDLFGIAYALADVVGLISAEPELGSDYFSDPEPFSREPTAESVDLLGGLCWVEGETPANPLWALETVRATSAWERSRGARIVIGQPDTGVAAHDELEGGMLLKEKGFNFVEGDPDVTDPLLARTANPGHGISTASVVASRGAGAITGAAPEAQIVPIRCIKDVRVFNAAQVARAVAHAPPSWESLSCSALLLPTASMFKSLLPS